VHRGGHYVYVPGTGRTGTYRSGDRYVHTGPPKYEHGTTYKATKPTAHPVKVAPAPTAHPVKVAPRPSPSHDGGGGKKK